MRLDDLIDTSAAPLMTWLALEREAVWLYPYIGGRVDELADLARDSAALHRRQRDALLTKIDRDPTTAGAAYDVGPITNVEQARKAAQSLERRIQAVCIEVLRNANRSDRPKLIENLRNAALAELRWGGTPRAFPGLDQ